MSRALVPVEENEEVAAAIPLDASLFEDEKPVVLHVDPGVEIKQKPAVLMEVSLDVARMVRVTLYLDEDGRVVARHEEDYYEILDRGPPCRL